MSNISTDQSQIDNVLEQIIEAAQTVIVLAEADKAGQSLGNENQLCHDPN